MFCEDRGTESLRRDQITKVRDSRTSGKFWKNMGSILP